MSYGIQIAKVFRVSLISGFCILFSALANAQFQHGTVVVFLVSTDRVIVAADSRASEPGGRSNDHACKIAALGTQLLFTEAGVAAGTHTILVSRNWSVRQEAIRAFSKFQVSRSRADPVDQVSANWLRSVKRLYLRELKSNREGVLSATTNDVLMTSSFVGLDRTGQVKVREIGISFDRAKLEKTGVPGLTVINHLWHITSQPAPKVVGHSEIAEEFAYQSTERGRAAQQRWQLEANAHRNQDTGLLYAVFLVDLTSSYAPPEWGVGGPVDEVEVLPKRGIQWIHRKPECSANSAMN